MPLREYNKKRTFDNTPEPTGGKPEAEALHFVVQKHDASRLHYDFRLEMEGVLKSWAIPKGPSLNPDDRRLAMMVEDHPYDYKDFEGRIPEGNYGAGTVIVWDEGTYESLTPATSKKKEEKQLLNQLKSGSLKIRLAGKKLKGEFALVHIKNNGRAENAWLLIKHRDEYAKGTDVTKKDKSVVSGKSIAQMEKNGQAEEWVSNRKAKPQSTSAKSKPQSTSSKAKPPSAQAKAKPQSRSAKSKPQSTSAKSKPQSTSSKAKPPSAQAKAKPQSTSANSKTQSTSSKAKPPLKQAKAKPQSTSAKSKPVTGSKKSTV